MYYGGYYGIDYTYLVLVVPALIISLFAQYRVKSTFSRYSQERCVSGLTGAETARRILELNGIYDIRIEHISGDLTDHYSPNEKVIRLWPNSQKPSNYTTPSSFDDPDLQFTSPGFLFLQDP